MITIVIFIVVVVGLRCWRQPLNSFSLSVFLLFFFLNIFLTYRMKRQIVFFFLLVLTS